MIKNYPLILIAFLCFSLSGFGQVTIAQQDFETVPATPTLNYSFNTGSFTSLSGNSGSNIYPTNSPLYTSSNTSWSVSNTYVDADFGPIDITSYTSVQLEFNLASFSESSGNGADNADYVDVYISLDNGVTWSYELEITGNSNARWNFSSGTNRTITYDGDDNPSSYSSSSSSPINNLIINIPDAVATTTPNLLVGFVVNNNNGDEIWNIDDIKVTGIPTATNTQVQFASSTYTESEDGTSVNLCVDIINESASSATTAQVVLTSGTAPHLSYTTQNITFPASSSTQQCVTVNIADNTNCSDSTDYTFEIQNVSGGDSAAAGSDDETTLSVNDDDAVNTTVIDENFSSFGTFTQVSETGSITWYTSGGYAMINGYSGSATNQSDWLIFNDAINLDELSNESLVIDYGERYSGNDIEVFYSTNFNGTFTSANSSSANWISLGTLDEQTSGSSFNDSTKTFDLSGISGTSVYIGLLYTSTTSNAENWRIDNIALTAVECSAPASPTITVTPNTLTGLDYIIGSGPSVEQSFVVDGILLTAGIDITAPTGFLISKTSGGTYTSSVNIPSGDANGSNTIYVILESGLGINTYSGNITMTNLTAGLATPSSVTVSGEVTAVPTGCASIFSDDFSGTLSQWSSTADWTISGDELKHDLSSTEGESYIYSDIGTQNLTTKNYEWSVCIRNGSWDPATGNNFAYFLTSSSLNLLFAPNGYAVGVNQGSSNDLLTLYSVSSGIYTPIVTSTFNWNSNNDVCIRVTRTAAGDWELLYDAGSGEVSGGTTNNTTHTTGRYTGQIFDYSSTRAGLLWVDDINICAETLVPQPELQLVDNSATYQDCGYTLDFGDVAIGSTSDLTFDIENIGTLDLNISNLAITGDYTIISPATVPFTITPGNAQTVTVQLTPLSDDPTVGELTITSNDADEGTCMVNLTGTGFTPGPNINVRGVVGSNPTIANGSTTTAGFNNTLFAAQTINSTQQTKTFRIGNEAGSADLTVSSITLSGDTADFFVTESISNPFAIDTYQDFDITFQPTTDSGLRSATVTIANSDSNKNPYTFVVEGNANCPSVSGTIAPAEGPVGTVVSVLSPGSNLTGATATLNGVALTTVSSNNAELLVRLPNTITTGGALSVELATGCIFSNTFTLINETIAGCETSSSGSLGDLFISEVTDSSKGSLTYIELYNATGATINFATTNYTIKIYNNGAATTSHSFVINSGSITNNGTFIIATGISTEISQCTEITGGDGSLGDMTITNSGASVNFHKDNDTDLGHDFIGLYNTSSTLIDAWGVYGDATWATGLGLEESGANFQRDTAATLPNTTFSTSDWIITDWTGNQCDDVDYSTIGLYDFSTGSAPTVTVQPVDADFNCEFSASFTITGTEGSNETGDTQELAYQWYYNAPGDTAWTEILSGNTDYAGQQSATLTITDSNGLDGYQYYCQLREDSATCFTASNAVKLEVLASVWDGSSWSTTPTIDSAVTLNGNYDTTIHGSFSACSLVVNSGYNLDIQNNTYIQIENNIIANGNITVFPQGSVVQINDLATVTENGNITVQKNTTVLNTNLDYTYWSSPVASETIENVFSTVPAGRRYRFDAVNFYDVLDETDNTGTFTSGQDDVDDDGNDWQIASGTMTPGMGYAAVPSTFGPSLPVAQQFQFVGPFNNGVITAAIVNNSGGVYNDWNFIGNPYPSAIDTNIFFSVNSGITDAIYLWNQATTANATASGSQGQNFSSADYAVISGSGVNSAGGDLTLIPNDFVPSGQGFFIEAQSNGPITFNNSMRVTGSNDQFFRNSNTHGERNVLWLNLTSDNGVAKQIAVAHLEGATDNNDGTYYDVKENLSSGSSATMYSTIADSEGEQFVIQGKNPSSLNLNEIIPIGFKTIITVPTQYTIAIAQFEGEFYNNNIIYIKDNLLNTTHNLKSSDYTFTSEPGEFNERFEIVFETNALSIDENLLNANDLSITELQNGHVEFKVGSAYTIKHVAIIDVTGRLIYNLSGNNATEVYDLSRLSQAAYVAKITLSNGQVISKKAIKQR